MIRISDEDIQLVVTGVPQFKAIRLFDSLLITLRKTSHRTIPNIYWEHDDNKSINKIGFYFVHYGRLTKGAVKKTVEEYLNKPGSGIRKSILMSIFEKK